MFSRPGVHDQDEDVEQQEQQKLQEILPRTRKINLSIFALLKFFIMREKEEDFNVDFLDPERVKATEEKVKSGKIVCDIHAPEGCENCSG